MAWMTLLLGAGFAGIVLVVAACIVSFQTGVLPDGSPGSEYW
jgi:hypothetical protein